MSDEFEVLEAEFQNARTDDDCLAIIEHFVNALDAIPNRTEMFKSLLNGLRLMFLADHCAILNYHRQSDKWFLEAQYGLEDQSITEVRELSRTVVEGTVSRAQTVLIQNTSEDDLTRNSRSIREHNIRSVMCSPIFDQHGKIWGVIYLGNRSITGAFDKDTLQQLDVFAKLAGTSVRQCETVIRYAQPVFEVEPEDDNRGIEPIYEFQSESMRAIMRLLDRAARHDVSVLLRGRTGTGKGVLAKWIHDHSARSDKPFVTVNCAALPPTLMEAELFGIEGNAATGVAFREGRLKSADGGTVLLDEVGEIPLSLQSKILRVIQDGVLDRVGSDKEVGIDVRFIFATHRDLPEMVKSGEFRSDLFYRMNVFDVELPNLDDRKDDIPSLATNLLARMCVRLKRSPMRISKAAMNALISKNWDGNIRELMNVLERAVVLSDGNELRLADDSHSEGNGRRNGTFHPAKGQSYVAWLRDIERKALIKVLEDSDWRIRLSASRLKTPESTLRSKMNRLDIHVPRSLKQTSAQN